MSRTHKAIIVAETTIVYDELREALAYIGAPHWNTDSSTDAEELIEFAGRLCYKSFEVGLNTNVTRIREGNQEYLGNVLKQKHGSVFEHASVSFALLNVSRILTHELVRHRTGTGYSQESQRFVRLDDFSVYIPDLTDALRVLAPSAEEIQANPDDWVQYQQEQFLQLTEEISALSKAKIANYISGIGLDHPRVPFHVKKQVTSALRRMLPGGVNTNILVSGNHRAWRYLIEARTTPGAEIEIREVFHDVGLQLRARYSNIYQDMLEHTSEGDSLWLSFTNSKI